MSHFKIDHDSTTYTEKKINIHNIYIYKSSTKWETINNEIIFHGLCVLPYLGSC